jgi:hypothetical protein
MQVVDACYGIIIFLFLSECKPWVYALRYFSKKKVGLALVRLIVPIL